MNRITFIYRGLVALLLVAVLPSCSLLGSKESPSDSDNIVFNVSEWSATKGSLVSESTIKDFGLYGFIFSAPWDTHLKPDFIANDQVLKSSGWKTPYRYPNDGRYLRFYAYSPYNCPGITLPDADTPGEITFKYQVPQSVADHKDLMVAMSEDILGRGATGNIPLTFHHALTAVRFETDANIKSGIVKSITIKGVYKAGTLSYGENPSDPPVWHIDGTKGDFVLEGINKSVVGGVADVQITSNDQYFLMLPQSPLPSGATLQIVFNDGTMDRTLTKLIEGLSWKQGEIVTYKISTTSF
jgi:hypothetical protein